MKTNKASVNYCMCGKGTQVAAQHCKMKNGRYQLWLARISDKLGLCCIGLHK